VTKPAGQVVLEATEEQKLRLQLAQGDRDLNLSRRCAMESEIGLYQTQKRLHELALWRESGPLKEARNRKRASSRWNI
jgi:hypothetical protein